jgi:DegV family protein with EDD domain
LDDNDVKLIPLSISDSNNKVYPDDGKAILTEELLTRLENGEVFKTSATPTGLVIQKIEELLKEYDAVIFFPITRGVSSQYQQALMIKNEFENKLFVVDTETGAGAMEFMVERVVEKMRNTDMTPSELVDFAHKLRPNISTYFSCEDLGGLIRGGRGKAALKAVNFLHLKPVLKINIGIELAGLGRNFKNNMQKMVDVIKSNYKQIKISPNKVRNIALYYSLYAEDKKRILLEIISKSLNFSIDKIRVRLLPAAILIHTLRGSYGIAAEIEN